MRFRWFFWVLIALSFLAPALSLLSGKDGGQGESVVCVLEIWHIDTFEGGKNSRAGYLKARASEFCQKNKGVYILVRSMAEEELKSRLSEGQQPDMFSFSPGTGEMLLPYLDGAGGADFREVLRPYTKHKNVQYAVPWCMGGYAYLSYLGTLQKGGITEKQFEENPLTASLEGKRQSLLALGYGAFNVPELALKSSGFSAAGEKVKAYPSQKDAYTALAIYDTAVLLGTQRDIVKMDSALMAGRADSFAVSPVSGFTDLVTYFGISKENAQPTVTARFFDHVLSNKSQLKLVDIGMFSVTGVKLYSGGGYLALEQALSGEFTSVNAFESQEAILAKRKDTAS